MGATVAANLISSPVFLNTGHWVNQLPLSTAADQFTIIRDRKSSIAWSRPGGKRCSVQNHESTSDDVTVRSHAKFQMVKKEWRTRRDSNS